MNTRFTTLTHASFLWVVSFPNISIFIPWRENLRHLYDHCIEAAFCFRLSCMHISFLVGAFWKVHDSYNGKFFSSVTVKRPLINFIKLRTRYSEGVCGCKARQGSVGSNPRMDFSDFPLGFFGAVRLFEKSSISSKVVFWKFSDWKVFNES